MNRLHVMHADVSTIEYIPDNQYISRDRQMKVFQRLKRSFESQKITSSALKPKSSDHTSSRAKFS